MINYQFKIHYNEFYVLKHYRYQNFFCVKNIKGNSYILLISQFFNLLFVILEKLVLKFYQNINHF